MERAVDADRLEAEIRELAAISDAVPPAVTRVLFTPPDMRARAWLGERFAAEGLAVRTDAVGNTFARWAGTAPELPAVATGSHVDAIPEAGMYDGVVGVLGALEAIRALKAAGVRPRRSIEIVVFTAEEPTRFGVGCLGSRLLAGALDADAADALTDADGVRLADARRGAGFTGPLAGVALDPDAYAAFLELHIEQGPLLEREGTTIGVVTAIAAPATIRMSFEGPGGHAGAVLMPGRSDPLLAAAELALAVDRLARGSGSPDTVGTVGLLEVRPGAVNSIPREVRLDIDLRDTDGGLRDGVLRDILDAGARAATDRGCDHSARVLNADPPAACDPRIVAAVRDAAAAEGLPCREMVSRAYHDALFMARVCPTGMVFVPSRDGVSHRPDEHTSPGDVAAGVAVLAGALVRLAA